MESDHAMTFHCLENVSPLYLDFISTFKKGVDMIEDEQLWHDALESGMRNRATGVLFRVRAKFEPDNHSLGDLIKDPETGELDKVSMSDSGVEDGYRTFYCYKKTVSVYIEEILRLEPTLAAKGITASSSIKELRSAGVKVFEDGYMYYAHWIKDTNYKYLYSYLDEYDEDKAFNFYAVLRNTIYNVKVTEVEELGMDLPCREIDDEGNVIAEGEDYMLCPIIKSLYLDETIISDLKNRYL